MLLLTHICTGGSIQRRSIKLGTEMVFYQSAADMLDCKMFQDERWVDACAMIRYFLVVL